MNHISHERSAAQLHMHRFSAVMAIALNVKRVLHLETHFYIDFIHPMIFYARHLLHMYNLHTKLKFVY